MRLASAASADRARSGDVILRRYVVDAVVATCIDVRDSDQCCLGANHVVRRMQNVLGQSVSPTVFDG